MVVWPKFVYRGNARWRTAATRWKLRRHDDAPGRQELALRALTRQLAAASYWRQMGVEPGMSYSRFQSRVPVHGYEQLAPAIAQMERGENDVLWPGKCALFGTTAGTSDGVSRRLPLTGDLLAHFRTAAMESLLYFTARSRHSNAFRGRHLFLGGPTKLAALNDGESASFVGEMSGLAALHCAPWVEKHFHEPGAAAAQNADWDAELEAIATRTHGCDISVIAGLPASVAELVPKLQARFSGEQDSEVPLQEHWPNLDCLAFSGAPLAPYAVELRRRLGPRVAFHETYAASECIVAAQDAEAAQGLRVMADAGVFFEFVPFSNFDELRVERLGDKTVPLAAVQSGVDYVILVTTPGGLARYILGDIVRFISVAPPRLAIVGGTQLRLNAFGENVMEKELTDTLVALCQRRDWTLVNFHVAPRYSSGNLTFRRGSHEWWVELKPGTVVTPTGPQMALELDADLQRLNGNYARKRAEGLLDAPTVRLVMPGVFEHWLRYHEKWGGQHKMPRCRSDRQIADEFAHVTNFARD